MLKERQFLLTQGGGGDAVQYETPAYTNAHGSGARTELYGKITCSAELGATLSAAIALGQMTDGNLVAGAGYPDNGVDVAGLEIVFDFSDFGKVIIDEMRQITGGEAVSGTWKNQGWNGSAWVDIGESFILTANATTVISLGSNTTAYTKYRWLGVSGTTSWNVYWYEIEFKIGNQL